jgi:hypothetical protein
VEPPKLKALLVTGGSGILWTARLEVPKDGAACEIGEAERNLPPAPEGK